MIYSISRIRFLAAVLVGKCISLLTNALHLGSGTAAPGLYAREVDSSILKKFVDQLSNGSIIIAGTNGKTTTSRLIAHYLSEHSISYIHNRAGSNLERGIISAFIQNSTITGNINPASIGLWEMDEAEFSRSLKVINPKIIVLLNLFRDQLDRYGEVDSIRSKWGKVLQSLESETTILFNADDPQLCALAAHVSTRTTTCRFRGFSIEGSTVENEFDVFDPLNLVLCPVCNTRLQFMTRTVIGQGKFKCEMCGFKNPPPEVSLKNFQEVSTGTLFQIQYKNEDQTGCSQLIGMYNMYNVAAAATLLLEQKYPLTEIMQSVESLSGAFGRMESIVYKKRTLVLILIKNPAGAQEALKTLTTRFADSQHIACVLNDNFADGKDVSWIWDIPWEKYVKNKNIVTAGTRVYDMSIRLHYAGVDEKNISPLIHIEDLFDAICEKTNENEIVPIFTTYTAMLQIQKICVEKGMKKKYMEEQ